MSTTPPHLGQHAIVIGGSVAGLLAARVLSDHYARVTILERDHPSQAGSPRKGVPQGQHVHVLFSGGAQVVEQLFPGFFQELTGQGAVVCDFSRDLCWYHGGVWKARPTSDLVSYWQSRPFLESHLRHRLLTDTQVQFREGCAVSGLLASPDQSRITGVELRPADGDAPPEEIAADLVVDASGRGSQTPHWLSELGYPAPYEQTVEVNIGYASLAFEPDPAIARDWQIMAVFGTPPHSKRTGYIFPIEGGRWLVSTVGFLKDYPPDTTEGFLEFARSLEVPDFYEALQRARPIGSVASFKFPANRWRRYDRLARFPAGLLPLGDAISSFNPVYGQGMSTAALEIAQLQQLLARAAAGGQLPTTLAPQFFHRAARIIAVPWLLATQSDFLYPETRGARPLHSRPLNWYLKRMLQLCSGNEHIVNTFYEVLHFRQQPTALFKPGVLLPVLGRTLGLSNSVRTSRVRPGRPH